MKFKEYKKVLALSMVLATGVSMFPTTAFAAEPEMQMELIQETETEDGSEEQETTHVEMTTEGQEDSAQTDITTSADEVPVETPGEVPNEESVPPTEITPPAEEEIPPAVETPEVEVTPEVEEAPQEETVPPIVDVPEEMPPVVENPPVVETPDTPNAEASTPESQTDVPEVVVDNVERPAVQTQRKAPVMKSVKKADNMRFQTVDKVHAFASTKLEFKDSMDANAKTVGTLDINGVCFILKDEGDWYFAESGEVRGFIKKADLLSETETKAMMKVYEQVEGFEGAVEAVAPVAEATVSKTENKAYFHTKTTVKDTVIEKKYALSTATVLNVREGKGMDHRVIATLPMDTLCYVIADADADWVYIESGDVRGFVYKDYITSGSHVDQMVQERGENGFSKANQSVAPKDNKAWFYTTTSVIENTGAETGVIANGTREEIVAYASQYIGNPYVWGGTDPVNGADCSGFVQSIYRDFGIEIPRVAEDQAYAGTQIPVEEAQPGDLIFYMDGSGYIYHVVMYAGNGTTVEAMNSQYGITTGNVMADACWAVTLLDDVATEVVEPETELQTETVGEYEIAFAE